MTSLQIVIPFRPPVPKTGLESALLTLNVPLVVRGLDGAGESNDVRREDLAS
jgi:hypothetical protein